MKNVKSTFSHAFSHKNGLTLIEGGVGFRSFALITVTFTCFFFLIIGGSGIEGVFCSCVKSRGIRKGVAPKSRHCMVNQVLISWVKLD